MRIFIFFIALAVCTTYVNAAQVAIIIDDIGYRQSDEAVLSLPDNITLSVLPHTPLGSSVAQRAHSKGYEVMLHLPMQALNGKKLGPGGITNIMSESEVKNTIRLAFESVPFAKGANNHMGSLMTQLEEPMQWVMETLKQKELYFVDSMTTRYTKAGEAADRLGIPQLKRQVFLDNDVSTASLERQFTQLMALAHRQGQVVAIAHPYPETIAYLKHNLPRLHKSGIRLVKTSELLPYRIANKENKGKSATIRLK
ncbi:divergent polysaccharide deacetylase family protein [Shewanella eurypsychrophilus]|uniref:Divergent polysaccharide deacetylase family protein n=1 Tax=Shewanella eurypsychrophilus TaxID=2593656 RepID=A0ABX6VC10_9GAMM|nr:MULTISPECIES: divergent polysaccharide deacetylase family protein [Shewanella]QFU25049.1 divergent polysaccharide deacetylase family protein [Shewanella sp. YLB-09]QPG60225.1 divergent polysaccharide deacetylase family protein [Shewanella eurypsychrophilus]